MHGGHRQLDAVQQGGETDGQQAGHLIHRLLAVAHPFLQDVQSLDVVSPHHLAEVGADTQCDLELLLHSVQKHIGTVDLSHRQATFLNHFDSNHHHRRKEEDAVSDFFQSVRVVRRGFHLERLGLDAEDGVCHVLGEVPRAVEQVIDQFQQVVALEGDDVFSHDFFLEGVQVSFGFGFHVVVLVWPKGRLPKQAGVYMVCSTVQRRSGSMSVPNSHLR